MVIPSGSVKMQEKRASATLEIWQNILIEKASEKKKDVRKNRLMKQKTGF